MYSYVRFSRRLCQAFLSSSCSRKNRRIPSNPRQLLEITFNCSNTSNLSRTLYSSSVPYRETNTRGIATECENGMAQGKFIVEYDQLLQEGPNTLIVDVREESEIQNTGVIDRSINIRTDDVVNELVHLPDVEFLRKYNKPKPTQDTRIIFSCRSGVRAERAQKKMQELGYTQVYNYKGGWEDWSRRQQR